MRHELELVSVKEATDEGLQTTWLEHLPDATSHARRSVAGMPAWLRGLTLVAPPEHRGRSEPAYALRVEPDALWPCANTTYLVELKSGEKNEPLGFAQVLYYRWMLRHAKEQRLSRVPTTSGSLTPVLITRPNAWLRGALGELLEAPGAAIQPEHCLELEVLRDRRQRHYYWLDAPHMRELGPLLSAPPHADIPRGARGSQWRQVLGLDTWVGAAQLPEKRPLFFTSPYAMLSRVEDSQQDAFLYWEGEPGWRKPKRGARAATWSLFRGGSGALASAADRRVSPRR